MFHTNTTLICDLWSVHESVPFGGPSQEELNPRDITERPGREMEVGLERLGNTCKLCYIEAKAAM